MENKDLKIFPSADLMEWERIYSEALASTNTLECSECGTTFFGAIPTFVIVCWPCWKAQYGTRNQA